MHIVRSFSRVYQNDCGYVHKMAKCDFHFHCHVRCALIIRFEANQSLSFVKNVSPLGFAIAYFLALFKN